MSVDELRNALKGLNAALEGQTAEGAQTLSVQTLAAEAVKCLGEDGLRELVSLLVGGYLQLKGGTLTGDLKVGPTTVQASDGHIILPSGVEIY